MRNSLLLSNSLYMDGNLPPGTTQADLDFRDEELEDTDTGLLDDDSECLEDRLEPLLENLQ